MEVNSYSLSLTRPRKDNIITCTPDHPFATYDRGNLIYKSVANIASNKGGAIIPTQINLPSNLSIEEQESDFYYLLGVILADGTISYKDAPGKDNPSQDNNYLQAYIRIYQSAIADKQHFIKHIERLLKSYNFKVSQRIASARDSKIKGRTIKGKDVIELTISDLNFVEKVRKILPDLSSILMTNPDLSLYLLAGYLDGDGSYNKGIISITVGKRTMFDYLVCTLLSLGIAYQVYRNRNNYVIEFRDNRAIDKLSSVCQRLAILKPPDYFFTTQFPFQFLNSRVQNLKFKIINFEIIE